MSDELLDLSLDDLLWKYWEIAYSEGKTGESRGTEAQQVLSSIHAQVNQLAADMANAEAKKTDEWRLRAINAELKLTGKAALQALTEQAQELDMGYGPNACPSCGKSQYLAEQAIKQLATMLGIDGNVYKEVPLAVRALQIEADHYEAEAKRYRFLRSSKDATADNGIPWCVRLVRQHGIPTSSVIGGGMLDVVIDAAMAKDKP